MKKFITLFFLIALLIFPQGKDVSLLKGMQNKFASLKDFSVDFSQESNGKTVMTGKLFFKKENMFYLDLNNLVIVSDGVTNWNYNKKEKKVIVSSCNADDASLFSPQKFVFDYPNQCKVTESTEYGKSFLLLIPKSALTDFRQAKVFPSAEETLERVVVTTNNGSILAFHFSNFRGSQNISKEKFSFQIPQGTKIIDLR